MAKGDAAEERAAFAAFDTNEQRAIRFLLDCAASRPDCMPVRLHDWLSEFGHDVKWTPSAGPAPAGLMLPYVDEFRAIHTLAPMRQRCDALSGEGAKGAVPKPWLKRTA